MWNLAYFIGVVVRKNTKILPAIVTTSHSFVQSYKSMIPTEDYYIHFETLWKKGSNNPKCRWSRQAAARDYPPSAT